MPDKIQMTTEKAVEILVDLKHGLFIYLHPDNNEALDMAIECLRKKWNEENAESE